MNAKLKGNWPMAYAVDDTPAVAGVSRTRIFAAIRNGEMIARKAGRQTIIEADELQRWIRSLPTRCRAPENQRGRSLASTPLVARVKKKGPPSLQGYP